MKIERYIFFLSIQVFRPPEFQVHDLWFKIQFWLKVGTNKHKRQNKTGESVVDAPHSDGSPTLWG